MRKFITGKWHAWDTHNGVMLSDEGSKTLRHFTDIDQCVNWLYLNGDKPAAREINKHWKEA